MCMIRSQNTHDNAFTDSQPVKMHIVQTPNKNTYFMNVPKLQALHVRFSFRQMRSIHTFCENFLSYSYINLRSQRSIDVTHTSQVIL